MKRRDFLAGSAAVLAGPVAAPRIGRSAERRVLKFIPQADVTILDPIWTTAYVTRNHGFMIFDTLYGFDSSFTPQPQMVAGHTVEEGGKLWRLTLRDGLAWHDGEKVLARDCVASIRRWAARDPFGQTLLSYTDDLAAPDDKTIAFRLKRPFPLLAAALGKPGSNFCAMMPERLAKTDPFKAVTEMVGSGPFKWKPDERIVGSLAVYERNADYQPREGGKTEWTARPKVAHFDRIDWHVIQDQATAAGALQSGEMDWWENPTNDILPLLRQVDHLKTEINDPLGTIGGMRLNHLWPPFDNPAIRRALVKAVNQTDFMLAMAGVFSTFWSGLDQINPVGHVFLRGNGKQGMMGWPSSPRIEELRQQWIDATDVASQKQIAEQLQIQALQDVPYIPLGQRFEAIAYQDNLTGFLHGFVMFWNVRRV